MSNKSNGKTENPNAEQIQGLREMADWLEAHPELPETYFGATGVFVTYNRNQKADLAVVALAMGESVKDYTDSSFMLAKKFMGGITITYCTAREIVCERVLVRTQTVPAHVIPAQPETLVPEREEPVYEWRCGSILAPQKEAELEAQS